MDFQWYSGHVYVSIFFIVCVHVSITPNRVKNYSYLDNAMNVSPVYLKHDKTADMADYRVGHYHISSVFDKV